MYEYLATVNAVHDGDTMRLNVDLGFQVHNENMDMRLYGVDAPELKRPDGLGEKARDKLKAWLSLHPGPWVITTVKDHSEKYGRYLIRTFTAPDKHELIHDQVTAGLLKFYDGRGPKPVWP